MRAMLRVLCVLAVVGTSVASFGQQYFNYNGVVRVVRLRILPGKTADFYKALGNTTKVLSAEQAAGLIRGFSFSHTINYEGPEKYDVAIVIEYKDMAGFDTLGDKAEPIIAKVYGSPEARAAAGRLAAESSEVVGSELVRGITLR